MLDAFPNNFNREFFLGKNVSMRKNEPEQVSEPMPEYQGIPAWADSIIQLVTSQVKTIEDLRREVSALHEELNQLKNKL